MVGLFREEPQEAAIKSPPFGTGLVSPSPSLHLSSAGKHSSLVVTLLWPLKLSALSAGKALTLGKVLPGHRGSYWTEDASTGHSEPSALPGTIVPLAAAKSPVPSGSIFLSASPCTPFPLVLNFLPHSHLHVPGWDHAASPLCSLTPRWPQPSSFLPSFHPCLSL